MDVRIRFTKKTCALLMAVVLCGLISWGCWSHSTFKARHDIKATCQDNCACFNNVVDYRLTNEQVRLFARFMKELQQRKNANVLEFMNTMDAISIQKIFSVCKPQTEPAPAPNEPEQPVRVRNKKK